MIFDREPKCMECGRDDPGFGEGVDHHHSCPKFKKLPDPSGEFDMSFAPADGAFEVVRSFEPAMRRFKIDDDMGALLLQGWLLPDGMSDRAKIEAATKLLEGMFGDLRIVVTPGPRRDGENDDGPRLQRAVDAVSIFGIEK